jgi:hypothetical protein
MSEIVLEEENYNPKITWLGGFVSVLGVNKGSNAALDSSIIWLIEFRDDQLRYPVKYGELPANANDITSEYGGEFLPTLTEDDTYTFWVMKGAAWKELSEKDNLILVDSCMSDIFLENQDTVYICNDYYTQKTELLDVYINIDEFSTFGRLADIEIHSTLSNSPVITWSIKEDGVVDTNIAAIGVVDGNQYDPTSLVWEVYSVDEVDSNLVYGENNIIPPPVQFGDQWDGTQVYAVYPESGLERNKTYYLWIANDIWDKENRLRFASGYCYATFTTN